MPLVVPEHFLRYNILGIDPGMKTGIGALGIDYRTNTMVSAEGFTIKTDRLFDQSGLQEDVHGERKIALYNLQQAILYYLMLYNPVEVGMEAPFFNRFSPMAYGSLTEVVTMITSTIIAYNPNIRITMYPPMTVKKWVGAKAVAKNTEKGKILVKDAVKAIPEIMNAMQMNIDDLSEHAIDGIAIGYTLIHSRRI